VIFYYPANGNPVISPDNRGSPVVGLEVQTIVKVKHSLSWSGKALRVPE
jgi:hypothetical protein